MCRPIVGIYRQKRYQRPSMDLFIAKLWVVCLLSCCLHPAAVDAVTYYKQSKVTERDQDSVDGVARILPGVPTPQWLDPTTGSIPAVSASTDTASGGPQILPGVPTPKWLDPADGQQLKGSKAKHLLQTDSTSGTAPPSGSNRPGAFTGGPTLSDQHGGWQADSPSADTDHDDGGDPASGSTSVDKNVIRSLNNDLAFWTRASTTGRRRARHLLGSEDNSEGSSSNEDLFATDDAGRPLHQQLQDVTQQAAHRAGFDPDASYQRRAQPNAKEFNKLSRETERENSVSESAQRTDEGSNRPDSWQQSDQATSLSKPSWASQSESAQSAAEAGNTVSESVQRAGEGGHFGPNSYDRQTTRIRRRYWATESAQRADEDGTAGPDSWQHGNPGRSLLGYHESEQEQGDKPAQYHQSDFELPADGLKATEHQVQQLRRLLAAARVPLVDTEQAQFSEPVPQGDWPDAAEAVGEAVQPAMSKRRLAQLASAVGNRQLLGSSTGRGDKPLWGVTYSWRRAEGCDGGKQLCSCPGFDALDKDLDLLYKYAYRFRTYSVECPDLMRMLLHYSTIDDRVSWLLGVWVGKDQAANQAQVDLLARLLEEYPHARISGIAVGNEAVSRGDATQTQVLGLINNVREKVNNLAIKTHNLGLSQLPILTVELPNYLTQELVAAVDVVGVNLQPFYTTKVNTSQSGWAAATVKGAIATYNQTAKKFPKKQLVVTEIGWPSRAGEADINRASEQLAGDFAKAWVQIADKLSIPYYYHELADAGWKTTLRKEAAVVAANARAARRALSHKQQFKPGQPVGVLSQGVLGDEHFGLVDADRTKDKQLFLI